MQRRIDYEYLYNPELGLGIIQIFEADNLDMAVRRMNRLGGGYIKETNQAGREGFRWPDYGLETSEKHIESTLWNIDCYIHPLGKPFYLKAARDLQILEDLRQLAFSLTPGYQEAGYPRVTKADCEEGRYPLSWFYASEVHETYNKYRNNRGEWPSKEKHRGAECYMQLLCELIAAN
jgi:hypothetical protein